MVKRGFRCRIDEGTYDGTVTVWVGAESIEQEGNPAIERAAWTEWRRTFGPGLGLAATQCTIEAEVTEAEA